MDSTILPLLLRGIAAALVVLAASLAAADPIVNLPPGTMALARTDTGLPRIAIIGELDAAGVLIAGEGAVSPELDAVSAPSLQLMAARIGLMGQRPHWTWLLRVDLAEATRTSEQALTDEPVQTANRFIDDAVLHWQPRIWGNLAVGRQPVPASRFRHLERARLTPGAVPLVVERVVPERRWGAQIYGDLGALSVTAGAFADVDQLEARAAGDPSQQGQLLVAASGLWTPRAPIGTDLMPTPPSDPWFGTARPSMFAGALWRIRAGQTRMDVSLGGALQYRRYAVMLELFAHAEAGALRTSAAGEASVLLGQSVVVLARGEYDGETELGAAGGGMALLIGRDRRHRASVLGMVRWPGAQAGDTAAAGRASELVLVQLSATL